MDNYHDLVALCVITLIVASGACFVATRPTIPSKRDERENAILTKLENIHEWMSLDSVAPLMQKSGQKTEINQLDTVALLDGIPEQRLARGQVGTVLEVLAQGVFLVEFSRAKDGREITTEVIAAAKLLKLMDAPQEEIDSTGRTA